MLKGTIVLAVGGSWTNLPIAETTLPFELQCQFEDYVHEGSIKPALPDKPLRFVIPKLMVTAMCPK